MIKVYFNFYPSSIVLLCCLSMIVVNISGNHVQRENILFWCSILEVLVPWIMDLVAVGLGWCSRRVWEKIITHCMQEKQGRVGREKRRSQIPIEALPWKMRIMFKRLHVKLANSNSTSLRSKFYQPDLGAFPGISCSMSAGHHVCTSKWPQKYTNHFEIYWLHFFSFNNLSCLKWYIVSVF